MNPTSVYPDDTFAGQDSKNVLEALNKASEILKRSGRESIPYQAFISCIAPFCQADRIYLFLNHTTDADEKLMSYIAEYCRGNTLPLIDNASLQNFSYTEYLSEWYDQLAAGEMITCETRSLSESAEKFLRFRGAESVLLVPVFADSVFYGFLGFDYLSERPPDMHGEIELLKSAGNTLSLYMERHCFVTRIKRKNELFKTVMDAQEILICAVDYDSYEVVYMNKFAVDAFGSGVGRKCWEVFFDNTEHACSFCMRDKLINDAGELSPPHPWEHFFEKTGKWYMCRSQALRWPNGRMVILLVAADITEHKHAEEKLQSIIEEKEHLFNEVHHRVKNNLQSLIYLIAMQADSVESRNAVEILNELKERIRAMSHVHSQLYNSKKLSSIDFGKYVCQLLNTLLRALAVEHISTGVNITEIHLDIKSAIPCGLIINELVTNIIKHAFNDYRSRGIIPEIKISMTKTGSQYILTVRDNGVGFKKRSSYMTGSSLGLKLVNIWATHQLGGTMEINDNSGVEFVISFPVSRG